MRKAISELERTTHMEAIIESVVVERKCKKFLN
jgi:hypothetical protein